MNLQDYIDKGTVQSSEVGHSVKHIARHHIESFNLLYTYGLENICKYLTPLEIIPNASLRTEETEAEDQRPNYQSSSSLNLPFKQMKIWFESLSIGVPMKD